MAHNVTRLQQIELVNFKNVQHGVIKFPGYTGTDFNSDHSEVLGIYGQNGSGKTALVDALRILRLTLIGEELPKETYDLIMQTASEARIECVFGIEQPQPKIKYLVFYELEITRHNDNSAIVSKETLSFKEFKDEKWTHKRKILDFERKAKESFLKPKKNYELLLSSDPENQVELGVARKLSEKNSTSFIFSNEVRNIISKSEHFNQYASIIKQLAVYGEMYLIVISNHRSGMINANQLIPLSIRLANKERIYFGDLPIDLTGPTTLPKEIINDINSLLWQMNTVLKTIIPGLSLGVKNYGDELDKDGRAAARIELVSIKDELQIPFRYESDGIKKIISILSALIAMYNHSSVCLVVDELDAGIFEYLLGELLEILEESGKGQLIFTSHNLRPLEMLKPSSLIFTTTNPDNRYIKLSNVKANNNLRNLYYRSINLGGQPEEIYKSTNSFEINRAFRIARSIPDEN